MEGVDSVTNSYEKKWDCTSLLRRVAGCISDSRLRVLLTDKEGGFMVLSQKLLNEKALMAIKDFQVTDRKPTKAKVNAVALLGHLKPEEMKSQVQNNKVQVLTVFTSAKSHKLDCPFRAIVTERGTWQAVVSRFLQHLNSLAP